MLGTLPVLLLKVPNYEKHVFSGLYIYKLVLSEPANCQNEEIKWFLHGLCSPPTGKTPTPTLLQAVQIQLLSLRNKRSHFHRLASSGQWQEISKRGAFIPDVKFGVFNSKIAVFRNVAHSTLPIFCPSYRTTEETVVAFNFLLTTCRLWFMLACMCVC